MSSPLRIRVTYCAECGYEPQTLDLVGGLMREFGTRISSIEIIPWAEGTFDVRVGDDLVHSMTREGGFPEYATVAAAVRARLSAT